MGKMMNKYSDLDINLITPDPDQPRKIFDDSSLTDLCNSIKATGVKQAITVRQVGDKYMIIAGERRYRASILAEKKTIPAIIIGDENQLSEEALYAHQLNENLHREDLNPIEKAEFINKRLKYLESIGIENPREVICEELGVTPSWISKALAPLKLEGDLRALVMQGKVKDYETVKKIKNLGERKQKEAIEKINAGNFNAKEFFSRRKPKIEISNSEENKSEVNNNGIEQHKNDGAIEQGISGNEEKKIKEEFFNFKVNKDQLEALFISTGFIHTINGFDQEQKETLYTKNKKELVEKFLESVTSS